MQKLSKVLEYTKHGLLQLIEMGDFTQAIAVVTWMTTSTAVEGTVCLIPSRMYFAEANACIQIIMSY
jgi:hypothetical protein